jgi:hypothetical protein
MDVVLASGASERGLANLMGKHDRKDHGPCHGSARVGHDLESHKTRHLENEKKRVHASCRAPGLVHEKIVPVPRSYTSQLATAPHIRMESLAFFAAEEPLLKADRVHHTTACLDKPQRVGHQVQLPYFACLGRRYGLERMLVPAKTRG